MSNRTRMFSDSTKVGEDHIGLVSPLQNQWAASQHLLRIIPDYSKGHPGYLAAFLMTPYGQHQLKAKIYGGVVDELTEDDTKSIWIPSIPLNLQKEIGDRVIDAYKIRDEANELEDQAIAALEALVEGRTPIS